MMEKRELLAEKVRQLREFLHKRAGPSLRIYAEECAQIALLEGDEQFIGLASIANSFSKFYEKTHISGSPELEELSQSVQFELAKASESIASEREEPVAKTIRDCEAQVRDLSSTLGRYVINIATKSRLKTAASIYAHGASLGRAADLCKVDKDELGNYIGHTTIPDKYKTMSVRERMEKVYAALGK